ncbi:MAG: FAD-dependent oxidoreductase [Thermomicrobiales bacterium]|nr:FAD-dependent oxidoreductase [Thermomicrobiales bacterium]
MMAPEVAVVGGGPAGLSAAIAAAQTGASVTLLEERPVAGGRLRYRSTPLALRPGGQFQAPAELADRAIDEARDAGVRIVTDAPVWGIFADLRLGIARGERAELIAPRAVVLATGSTDLPLAFPGWTTPGVFSGRAVLMLVNQHRVLPGRRWAIVGGGVERERIAADLRRAGADVVVMADPGEVGAVAVFGSGGVEAIAVGDARVAVDCVAVAAGRQPDAGLATMADCELGYDPELGGWAPACDAWGRTSVDRIVICGDAAGICGPTVAAAEGRLAGLAAAAFSGRVERDALDAALATESAALVNRKRVAVGSYAQPYR